ncbi:MAG: ATP-binding cassette domain-containing protein, partial [Spirochaetia bacterium]|nr:ATP-binding cassette domain-containing protein [Spirochaetia bacterium]
MKKLLLNMQNITKIFTENGVKAVNSAELKVGIGEIHSIIGENGAGKSTLMHILAGEIIPDTGSIIFENQNIEILTPSTALKHGIAMLHQHLKLIPELTVLENIILGVEPSTRTGTLNKKEAYYKISKLCEEFDIYADPNKLVRNLTSDEKQITALLSILYHNIKLLILDEPTTFFSEIKTDTVHKLIRKLQFKGKSIIIITHKLKEAIDISDKITVMKAGKTIEHLISLDTDIEHLSSL